MFLAIIAGQTDCVSLINNFLSVEDLEYFTKPRGILNAADAEEDNFNVPCFLHGLHQFKSRPWLNNNVLVSVQSLEVEVPGLTLSESSIRCFNFPLTHETIALNHRLHLENTCKKSLICEASMDGAHFSVYFFKKNFYS